MSELPSGWAEIPLKDIVFFQEGPGLRKWQFADEGMPFLNIRTFDSGRIDKSKCRFVSIEEFTGKYEHFLVDEGDIIVSSSGTIGKLAVISKSDLPLMLNTSVIRFRSLNETALSQSFLKTYLRSQHFFRQIDSSKTGSAIENYGPSHLKKMTIVIPPLNEQKRIVEKLEKLLGQFEAAQERLDKTPAILKRFRQSVLAAACSGKLTTIWRREKKINLNTDLPLGWKIETVGNVIDSLKYGTSQKCSYAAGGKPVLRIPNIGEWTLDTTDLKYAELSKNEFDQLKLKAGDILLIRSNGSVSLVGKTAIVQESEKNFAYAGYLIRLRPNRQKAFPEFFNYVLGSHDVRIQIEIPARSTSGVNNINSTEVKALIIPLPPLEEQKEIVRRVEELFKFADQIEERYKKARSYTDKLTQSILAKAFRGELVPQDPNDEPASVLLEQVRKERGK